MRSLIEENDMAQENIEISDVNGLGFNNLQQEYSKETILLTKLEMN